MVGAEAIGVERRPVLPQAAQEAGERLAVGLRRAGRFPLDRAAGQVGCDEGGKGRSGGQRGVHGPSMDALLAREVKSGSSGFAGLLGDVDDRPRSGGNRVAGP